MTQLVEMYLQEIIAVMTVTMKGQIIETIIVRIVMIDLEIRIVMATTVTMIDQKKRVEMTVVMI